MKQNDYYIQEQTSADDLPLFSQDALIQHPQITAGAASASRESYYSLSVQAQLPDQERICLEAIRELGEACDTAIAEYTGLSKSIVPDRRGRLLSAGQIEFIGKKLYKKTGKTVSHYRIII